MKADSAANRSTEPGESQAKSGAPSITDNISDQQRQTKRERRCRIAATAMVGATLASSVLVTADATSVYEGESLPQVLLVLLTVLVASFGSFAFLPSGSRWRLWSGLLSVLVVCLLLSTFRATWFANGRAAWNGFWHVIALLALGMMTSHLSCHRAVARAFSQLLFVGAIALSVHALHQVAISLPETRAAYERNPDQALAELNLDAPPGSATRARYESRLYSTEPLATFALANSLAVLLSGALVALSFWIAHMLRTLPVNRSAVVAAGVAWLLILTAWLLTKSRTAYLSVIVVAAVTIGLWWWQQRRDSASGINPLVKHQPKWIAAVALSCIIAFGALVTLLARDQLILSEAPKSVAYRLEYWQASARMILDFPLSGVGLGNFQSYYPRYKLETASEIVADPHNWLFDIAATCSLPALVLTLIALVTLLSHSWASNQLARRLSDEEGRTSKRPHADTRGKHTRAEAPDRQMVMALVAGAALGWLFTAAMQWFVNASIDVEASTLGLIIGLILIAFMRRSAEPSESQIGSAALAGAITMLVCLLASGSWQASGLAMPLAVWLGICAAGAKGRTKPTLMAPQPQGKQLQTSRLPTTQLQTTRLQTTGATLAARAVALGLLFAFVLQSWRPVNMSWTKQQSALAAISAGVLDAARGAALASVAADSIDPAPRRLLVQVLALEAERQTSQQFETATERVAVAIERLLECDPSSSQNWSFAGEVTITLAARAELLAGDRVNVFAEATHDPAAIDATIESGTVNVAAMGEVGENLLTQAEQLFSDAIERYPSNVALHVQRAVILALLDKPAEARRAAQDAFKLSEATPHLDRKLGMLQVWLPPPLAAAHFPQSATVRLGSSMWVQAEPLCALLRKP